MASSLKSVEHSLAPSLALSSLEMVPMPTKADGDCAFHAALGIWDEKERQYVCANPDLERKKVAEHIRKIKLDSPFAEKLKEALEILAQRDQPGPEIPFGPEMQRLRAEIHAKQQRGPKLWLSLENDIKKTALYSYVINYIDDLEDELEYNPGRAPLPCLKDFRNKFDYCYRTDKSARNLQTRLAEFPNLFEKYGEYHRVSQEGIDYKPYLKDKKLMEEYAELISKRGYWLSDKELAMLAYALNITIEFHFPSVPGRKDNSLNFNPGQAQSVKVFHNGHNHFSRMEKSSLGLQSFSHSGMDERKERLARIGLSAPKPAVETKEKKEMKEMDESSDTQSVDGSVDSTASSALLIAHAMKEAKQQAQALEEKLKKEHEGRMKEQSVAYKALEERFAEMAKALDILKAENARLNGFIVSLNKENAALTKAFNEKQQECDSVRRDYNGTCVNRDYWQSVANRANKSLELNKLSCIS